MEISKFPLHQRLFFGCILTAAAGGLDAYTYLEHGEVFAGLQTGNVILLGISVGSGHFMQAWKYVISIAAFLVGVVVIRHLQYVHEKRSAKLNRQLMVLSFESVVLVAVACVSGIVPDVVSTAMLSVAAAAQLQEFRKLKGGPFTSLMMTGNLRTLAENAHDSVYRVNEGAMEKLVDTISIIVSFTVGAAVVALGVRFLSGAAVLIPAALLVAGIVVLLASKERPSAQ